MIVGLAVVAVLAVAAVAAFGPVDRWAATRAERAASAALSVRDGHVVQVRVHGRPFLPQALRGRYGDIEVTVTDLRLGELEHTDLHSHLVNARLPLADLLARRAVELACDHVHGHVVVPWDELARRSRVPGLALVAELDGVVVSATLPVPGLGQLAGVSGRAAVQLGEDGACWVRVRRVAVAGIALPSLVVQQLAPALSFRVPLPELPYGLRVERLAITPDGLRVEAAAGAVVLRPGPG